MACGVEFVLFKSLYVKIAFIATLQIFHYMGHSKLSAKTASVECILFFLQISASPMTNCWVYLVLMAANTIYKV